MSEREFLDGYGGQSTRELLELRDRYRTDSIVLALEEALGHKADRHGLGSLRWEERVVLAVEAWEREVNNGGYEQFFSNASCEFAGEVAAALDAIGCPRYANTARRAFAALGVADDAPRSVFEAALHEGGARLRGELESCDDAFFGVVGEDVAERLLAFVESNADRIEVP